MSKRVAIVQSSYIPWKGYFDLINMVDEFILYDDAQYTRRDWRNRNRIKTPCGCQWLTIPVSVRGKYLQQVKLAELSDSHWAHRHWRTIVHNYARSAHFPAYRDRFEDLYGLAADERYLSRVNLRFIEGICSMLGIGTKLSWSMDYRVEGNSTEKLLGLCKQAKATEYITGPAARAYLDSCLFSDSNISVKVIDYLRYPTYRQLHPPFVHNVSVIDLIFNEGEAAPAFMKSF